MQGGGGERSRERSQGRRDYNSSNGDRQGGSDDNYAATHGRRKAGQKLILFEVLFGNFQPTGFLQDFYRISTGFLG